MTKFIFTIALLALANIASAGVIEDILKLEAALKSGKKEIVCNALSAELRKTINKKQKLLTVIQTSTGAALNDAKKSFSEWSKVEEILGEQIKNNACGGVK